MNPLRLALFVALASAAWLAGCGPGHAGDSCDSDHGCQGSSLLECVGVGNTKAGPSTAGHLVLVPCRGPEGCAGDSSNGYTCDISLDVAGDPCGGTGDEAPGAFCRTDGSYLGCGSAGVIEILQCPQGCAAPPNGSPACNPVADCTGAPDSVACVNAGAGYPECCGGQCVDSATNSANCGACGAACPAGQTCNSYCQ